MYIIVTAKRLREDEFGSLWPEMKAYFTDSDSPIVSATVIEREWGSWVNINMDSFETLRLGIYRLEADFWDQ